MMVSKSSSSMSSIMLSWQTSPILSSLLVPVLIQPVKQLRRVSVVLLLLLSTTATSSAAAAAAAAFSVHPVTTATLRAATGTTRTSVAFLSTAATVGVVRNNSNRNLRQLIPFQSLQTVNVVPLFLLKATKNNDDDDNNDNININFSDVDATSSSSRRKKRTRRKTEETVAAAAGPVTVVVPTSVQQDKEVVLPADPTTSTPQQQQQQLQPRRDSVVQMQVMDVRDFMKSGSSSNSGTGGTPKPANINNIVESSSSSSSSSAPSNSAPTTTGVAAVSWRSRQFIQNDDDDDSDDDDDDEQDPLARLLEDAKQMRVLEDAKRNKNAVGSNTSSGAPEGNGVMGTVKNVLSTIVTVDFFFVCALFLWFLAGIFCSYILKDDAVQIAFNGIFQAIVQPSLGLLMIASISDAVLKGDDDNNNNELQ